MAQEGQAQLGRSATTSAALENRGDELPARSDSLAFAFYLTCEADRAHGSAYVALGFADRLVERGHTVEIVELRHYEPFRWLRRANFYRQSLGLLLHSVLSTLRRNRDVLLFYGGEAWLAIGLLSFLPRRMRPLLVLHSNGLEPHCAKLLRRAAHGEEVQKRRWFQLDLSGLTSLGFRKVDGLVVVSEFEGQYARNRDWPRSGRLLVVDNPLPASFLGISSAEERELVVGFCGTWMHHKGISRLVRELPVFLRRNEDWRFRILGTSGENLQAEFPSDIRNRIEQIPPMEREIGLAQQYRRLAVMVSPSVYESFGLVVAEAMACGCAVVASPVGFAAHLRDREEVLLCDAAKPGALAAALEEVARDPVLRGKLAKGGWSRVQALRWQSAGDRFEAALSGWWARPYDAVVCASDVSLPVAREEPKSDEGDADA